MNLSVLAKGFGGEQDVLRLRAQPAFRKATKKMMMACASIEAALNAASAQSVFAPGEIGLVLVSGFGELEATADFLRTWNESKLARPLLFQNSLHNSSAGFAAIQFKLLGPVLTINHRVFGGEQALDLADSLIADEQCRICLVTSVETTLPEFADGDSGREQDHSEGATTLLVSSAQIAKEFSKEANRLPLAQIRDIVCEAHESRVADASGPVDLAFQTLYGSDAIRSIGKLLDSSESGSRNPVGETVISKPSFGRSVIRWA